MITAVMNYKNTHIRALATLLAFASVILTPATASAQNATSQQPAATVAGSSENSDKTNQATEQASAQPVMSLQQRLVLRKAWVNYWDQQDIKLGKYADACGDWLAMYGDVAVPAIKKHGTKQEQEVASVVSQNTKDFMKALKASWGRTRKSSSILDETADRLLKSPSEKNFKQYILQSNDVADVFNTESENSFKIGQNIVGYHQQITAVLDGIIARLRENPKTQADADKIDSRWQREPDLLKVKAPIKMIPFDPTKPIPQTKATPQGGAKQVRVRKVNQ